MRRWILTRGRAPLFEIEDMLRDARRGRGKVRLRDDDGRVTGG